MKRLFSFAAALLLTAVCFAQSPAQVRAQADSAQVIELEAYCSFSFNKDAQNWSVEVEAVYEFLNVNFFLNGAGTTFILELPNSGTYSTAAGNIELNYAMLNRANLDVASIEITLANTMPWGAMSADMMMYLTDGTIYHLVAVPSCEETRNTIEVDIPDAKMVASDTTVQTPVVQISGTVGQYTYSVYLKTTPEKLNGTYGDGDWMEMFTHVAYEGYDSQVSYELPCSVSAVVEKGTAHVVMHMWNGLEYIIDFHYALYVDFVLYNHDQAITLTDPMYTEDVFNANFHYNNDVNHMDSIVITLNNYRLGDGAKFAINSRKGDVAIDLPVTRRDSNVCVVYHSFDFKSDESYLVTLIDGLVLFSYGIHNTQPAPVPAAQTLVYNGGEAIELVAGIDNDLNHMDSVVVTFSGFEMEYDAVYELYDESRETFYKGWMTARGNQTYVYHRSLDFAPGKKYQLLVEEWGQTDGKSFLYDIVNSEPVPEPTAHALLYNGGEAIELVEYRKPEREVNCANHMDSLVVMLSDFDSVDEVAFSFYDHNFWGSQDRTMTPRGNNVYAVAFPQDFFKGNSTDLRYEIRVIVNPYSHSSAKSFSYFIYYDGTAIELVEQKSAPAKTLRNGHLVISVGDAEYTVDGTQLK